MLHKFLKIVLRHKINTILIVLVLLIGSYVIFQSVFDNSNGTQYILADVQKGTLAVTVTGTGQISASTQVDIKPKSSGEVVYIGVQNGQWVKTGATIVTLDNSDAQKAVRDAEINLASAELTLEKLKGDLQVEPRVIQRAKEDLQKVYDDGFNTVADVFLDLPSIVAGMKDMLVSTTITSGQWNVDYYASAAKKYDESVTIYRDDVIKAYETARKAYDVNFSDYKSVNRFSDDVVIEKIINQTYDTTKALAEAVKSFNNLIEFYKDKLIDHDANPIVMADVHLAALNTYTSKTNMHLLNLLAIRNAIMNAHDTLIDAGINIKAQELAVQQKNNALSDAQETLADYTVRAPFEGMIAKISVKRLDVVSGSTIIGTLITSQKVAEIPLNEIDAAKVKVGQKASVIFDAIEHVSLEGTILEIDAVGTVVQGVVTYTVKIGFTTQDDRVKTGMSVTADIITDERENILIIPNSAVKSQKGKQYVEIFDEGFEKRTDMQGITSIVPPRQQFVETGISNDTYIEIISGLIEGDEIVVRTVNNTESVSSQQAPSFFNAPSGGNRSGGSGQIRIPR